MSIRTVLIISLWLMAAVRASALQPDEIMVVANGDLPESYELAKYYCLKRDIPVTNVFLLPLGSRLEDTISRKDYETCLASPLRKRLAQPRFSGKIRCLLTTYGIPFKVDKRGSLTGHGIDLIELNELLNTEEESLKLIDINTEPQHHKETELKIARIKTQIDCILGKETSASVDSELSMLRFADYELYRWQINELKGRVDMIDAKTLMVSRIDGPGLHIARQLIDKALSAEKNGLKGSAYIDSRGIHDNANPWSYGFYDQSLRDLDTFIKQHSSMPVAEESTPKLFPPDACPDTALYCGWYSVSKYIDAFSFVDGAVGFHIASFEAKNLRDSQSSQWCPAMLQHGITATLGPVAEPYLLAFPLPKDFFSDLIEGKCLVEAFYDTNPFNSWQLILIGDPLYTPFKKP